MTETSHSPAIANDGSGSPASVAVRRLLLATDLAELVAQYSPLQATGAESVLRGHCPLRPDRTALFFVLQSETFRCLGCGAHGNVIDFVMQADRTTRSEAVQRIQTFVESRQRAYQRNRIDSSTFRALADVHASAAELYSEQLKVSAEATGYLQKRGVADEAAAHWMLGYSPGNWLATQDALRNYPIELLVKAGLVIQGKDGKICERFRGRLTFPIRGPAGDIVAFGGRLLGQGEAKYVNSPETVVFQKGRTLYGQFESSLSDATVDRLWVVEGYMDVVTLWQHGIRNCVATLGTSTTTEHVLQLFRSTQELLFCFDGDPAGRSAAWRALERTLPALRTGRRVRFLILPQGEDPDSLVRNEGIHSLHSLADKSLPLPIYLARELATLYDTSHIDGRARYLACAATLLAQVSDRTWRSDISSELAAGAQVTSGVIERLADAEKATNTRLMRPRFRVAPT